MGTKTNDTAAPAKPRVRRSIVDVELDVFTELVRILKPLKSAEQRDRVINSAKEFLKTTEAQQPA